VLTSPDSNRYCIRCFSAFPAASSQWGLLVMPLLLLTVECLTNGDDKLRKDTECSPAIHRADFALGPNYVPCSFVVPRHKQVPSFPQTMPGRTRAAIVVIVVAPAQLGRYFLAGVQSI